MDSKPKSSQHQNSSEIFLRETEHNFFRKNNSGLYYPKTQENKNEITTDVKPALVNRRTIPIRSFFGNLSEILSVFISSVSLLLTLATLIGLIFTVKFTIKQWSEMNAANNISKESLANARDSFRFDERPWIEIVKVGQAAEVTDSYQIVATYSNFGRSPAFKVRSTSKLQMSNSIKTAPHFVLNEENSGPSMTLGSQATDAIGIDRVLTPQEVIYLNDPNFETYWGIKFWYEDFWGNSYTETTCQHYMVTIKKWQVRNPQNCAEK